MVIEPTDNAASAVVAEVRAAFETYETALIGGDVDTMQKLFWTGDGVVRYGIADMQHGADELRRWRRAQPPLPPGRTLHDTQILALGPGAAVATTCFTYPGRRLLGRQTQVWVRLESGWRIVAAHVSEVPVET